MDWVKPKHRARRLKSAEGEAHETEKRSATQWLEQLCEENVTLLQSSLPVGESQDRPKAKDYSIDRFLNAMMWGTGDWEVEKPSSHEFLHDLVEAFSTNRGEAIPEKGSSRRVRGGKRSQWMTTEYRAQQVAHASKIGKWIAQQLPKSSYDPYVALTSAGWLHALPVVGRDIPPALWLDVLQSTLTQVDRAWETGSQDGLFPWVIWACEIPLALAKQLSHLGGKDRIVSDTLNRIALLLEQTADDPRVLMSFGAQDLRAVVACLIRSRWSADGVGARKWYPPQRKALAKLASLMLHLTDGQGKSLLTDSSNTRHDPDLWASVLEQCSTNKKLKLAAAAALPDNVGKGMGMKPSRIRKDKCNEVNLPKPSVYWESNRIATMRRSWRDVGFRVAVDFSSDVVWLDIVGEDGERVFSGDWDIDLKKNGKPVDIDVAWEEVCWFSDDDVDYLELECDLEETCKIQRQVMLMREEGMVLMADAVISDTPSLWELRSHWTLDPRIAFVPQSKSNDAMLQVADPASGSTVHSPSALLLPLGMPEWRRGNKDASLTCDARRLTLQTSVQQARMYSPLLVALRGLSKNPAFTWRHLTIAQDLVITSPDIARGFRVQVGKEQWVIYRSLGPCKRRSLMGLHLNTEFYAARFLADDGSYEPLVEVNAE